MTLFPQTQKPQVIWMYKPTHNSSSCDKVHYYNTQAYLLIITTQHKELNAYIIRHTSASSSPVIIRYIWLIVPESEMLFLPE